MSTRPARRVWPASRLAAIALAALAVLLLAGTLPLYVLTRQNLVENGGQAIVIFATFVTVGGQPIRASKADVEWCLKGVDQCWSQKQRFIRAQEMEDAKSAYDHARVAYRRILGETEVE